MFSCIIVNIKYTLIFSGYSFKILFFIFLVGSWPMKENVSRPMDVLLWPKCHASLTFVHVLVCVPS